MAYATIEYADDYFSKIYDSAWGTLEDDTKQVLLENGTINIDKRDYSGEKLEPTQLNKFPRKFSDGSLSDDNLVKQACCEEAINIYKTGGVLKAGEIKSFKLGNVDVDLTEDAQAEVKPPIDDLLKDYLLGNIRIVW